MFLRVVLSGSECTGKSSLAARLAEHYKVEFVPEYLREYFEMKNGHLTVDDVIPIARGQLRLESGAAAKGYNPLICDTDIISSIVYAKHYFNECPGWLDNKLKELGPSFYLLCDIDIQWQADGQRDMPQQREYMQGLFVKELNNRNIPYHIINGSLPQRTVESIRLIDEALAASAK
ncbi:AAA family ATPase [Desulfovibrio sp. JC022]|uniref:AAA family ATPase n=1 Tax=Desulfovibrio sp. JC022 TaxID=2593642 RepID=UPI0013D4E56D|nr:ATP-binding protein [Desulfovibrio sp. JC022]NDV22960.1 ATP-binding protein [Desulfovibrio sp. JC022]